MSARDNDVSEEEIEEAGLEEVDLDVDTDHEEGPDEDDLDEAGVGEALADDDDDDDVDDDEEEEEDDDDTTPTTRTKKRTGDDEEEDDDDLLSPDDVEADLDRILKDRMVTTEDEGDEEDDAEVETDERGEGGDRLQPKRADEQLCPSCFLLVRASAPNCPVGDDACPVFSR